MKININYLLEVLEHEDTKKSYKTNTKEKVVVPTQNFLKYENLLLENANALNLLRYAYLNLECTNFEALQQKIIQTKNSYICYLIAKDFTGVDVKKLGRVVAEGKNAVDNFNFARDVKGADVRLHGVVIAETNDVLLNYHYASEIEGADLDLHMQVALDQCEFEIVKRFEWLKEMSKIADVKTGEDEFESQIENERNC